MPETHYTADEVATMRRALKRMAATLCSRPFSHFATPYEALCNYGLADDVIASLGVEVPAPSPADETMRRLARSVRCPTCQELRQPDSPCDRCDPPCEYTFSHTRHFCGNPRCRES